MSHPWAHYKTREKLMSWTFTDYVVTEYIHDQKVKKLDLNGDPESYTHEYGLIDSVK